MQTVLVTGASTGIGRATAALLARRGMRVLATVRKQADAEALAALGLDGLETLFLDVTDQEGIDALAEQVDARVGEEGLYGLVNNAGVAVAKPLEVVPLDELRWQLEVNVVGLVAVTQACMPALRRAKGRIVNIGSTGSRIAPRYMGPYTASKHAVVAITAALRQEIRDWGMHASIVEPGAIATDIWDKGRAEADRMRQDPDPTITALYPHVLEHMAAIVERQSAAGIPPERVGEAVHHALTARRPRTRYPVGTDAKVGTLLAKHLPERWMEWVLRAVGR